MAENRKTKKTVSHNCDLEFSVPGDDQAKVLDVLTRLRAELDDIKFSEVTIRRYENTVYVD